MQSKPPAMRKRSSYRPRPVRLDNLAWVKSGLQPMRENPATVDLRIKNHASMAAIARGQATRTDIDVMIAALNVTEALATNGLGNDWAEEIRAGQDALLTLTQRGIARGDRFICTGPELTALNLAMDVHDAQLDGCTVAGLEAAIDRVYATIRAGKSRKIEQTH